LLYLPSFTIHIKSVNMHLSALIPFLALPFLATSLPTSDQVDAVVHLERRAETAGSYPDGPNFRFLEANGGCSPNFNRVVNIVIVYQGFRCRFYRYVL
jgi:hypothetical protein